MKISQLISNLHPTNLLTGGAIYSHVASLSNGLVEKGHEVHLFATSESETNAQLHAQGPSMSKSDSGPSHLKTLNHIAQCYEFSKNNADLIHSHYNLLPAFFSKLVDVPTISSIHSPITDDIKPFLEQYRNNRFISFSLAQRKQMPNLNWYANIYHGVDTNIFTFEPESEDYFVYLGRITEDKGVHFAIEAAKACGVNLRIAGKSYEEEGYWHKYIEPHVNGDTIRYFGELPFNSKISFLQKAKAVLFPVTWNEPFGYVMIEAMSCGTPVIGFDNGSVAEIIQDGETGFVVNDVEGMIDAIKHIDDIERIKVRKRAERYFSVERMVSGYEAVYKRVLDEEKFKKAKRDSNK